MLKTKNPTVLYAAVNEKAVFVIVASESWILLMCEPSFYASAMIAAEGSDTSGYTFFSPVRFAIITAAQVSP